MITLVATDSSCLGRIDVSPRKVCLSGQWIIVAPSHCSGHCVTSALTLSWMGGLQCLAQLGRQPALKVE